MSDAERTDLQTKGLLQCMSQPYSTKSEHYVMLESFIKHLIQMMVEMKLLYSIIVYTSWNNLSQYLSQWVEKSVSKQQTAPTQEDSMV